MAYPVIEAALSRAVDQGVFPGAVLLVSHRGKVCFHEAVGYAALRPRKIRMRRDTVFDLASLTKPVATTTAVIHLLERAALKLEDPVRRWVPEFSGGSKDRVTVHHLLNHSSGLRAWEPIYKSVLDKARGRAGFIGSVEARRMVLDRVHHNRLVYAPGSKSLYSDLGFILLGELIENVIGDSLDRFCRKEIFGPLKMRKTFFIPSGSKRRAWFAATEQVRWRRGVVNGTVHDDHAHCMGGVAGHAGLFATAGDLNRFARMMLDSVHGRDSLIPHKIAGAFVTRHSTPGSSRALGWDTPSDKSSSGRFFSKRAFGHLGYTGTSIWIDPEPDLAVILLTNRVHPTSRNTRIQTFRPSIHDLVYQEIVGEAES